MMTKKLIWRLKEPPTSRALVELVDNGLLTKEEAKQILFSSETENDRDNKSLKSEIKFLRELVEKLSKSKTNTITTIREIEAPYRRYSWYEPYTTWYGSTTNHVYCSTTDNATGEIISASNSTDAIDFTDIKTF